MHAGRRAGRSFVLALVLGIGAASAIDAQTADSSRLTVERIFGSREFTQESLGPVRWLDDSTYTAVEPSPNGSGNQLVRIDAASGRKAVLVGADLITSTIREPSSS